MLDPELVITDPYSNRSSSDFRVEWFSGSGAGGQHRNRHLNSCRVIHIPTGIVESRQGRKRADNLEDATKAINEKLCKLSKSASSSVTGTERKQQIGSGMRGDKTVTIRFQDDTVTNHVTNKTMTAKKYMSGHMSDTW